MNMDAAWSETSGRVRDAAGGADAAARATSTVVAADDVRGLKLYWALFAACAVLACAPLWTTKYPPLLDYPNHLARAYVIYHYDDNGFYRGEYDRLSVPVPNMAIDLVVPPLLRFFEVKTAGKIFLTLTFLLFALGCHMLGVAVHGRPTWLALAFALLVFNQTVLWGFVNYFFGVGLFLITFSLWLRWRESWTWVRLVLVVALAFAAFIAHLSAYAFLGVALTTVTLFDAWAARRATKGMLLGLAPLLPPLATFVAFMRGPGRTGELVWGSAAAKVVNLAAWPVGYNYALDGALLGVVLLACAVVLLRSKSLRVSWALLVSGLLFWLLYVLCPQAVFTSYSADARFIAPALVFTLLAFRFEVGRKLGTCALALILVAAGVKLGGVWAAWRRIDVKTEAQLALFERFEDGARVYPITFFPPDREGAKNERPIHHVIHYATISRHIFAPTFFAYSGQQPVVYKERPRYVKITEKRPPEALNWAFIFDKYDYIWGYQLDEAYRKYLTERCDIVAENDGGVILRIRKPQAASQSARFEAGRP